jgi:hypothetical protein
MTVQQLRNMGYKVRVLHCRLYNGYHTWQVGGHQYIQKNAPVDPDSKGGSTQVIIDSPDGQHFRGLAMCSKKDNYNKKMGVKIALGRSGVTCDKNTNHNSGV